MPSSPETNPDLRRIIDVDMDALFAAVKQRDLPSLFHPSPVQRSHTPAASMADNLSSCSKLREPASG